MKFVRGKRKKVNWQVAQLDRNFPNTLDGVSVKQDAFFATDLCDFLDWKQHSGLVIGRHQGHNCCLRANRLFQFSQSDVAVAVHAQKSDLTTALSQFFAMAAHGTVLHRAGDNMFSASIELERGINRSIIRLGPAARENNFGRLAPQQIR